VIGEAGLLIRGSSGSGKSTLLREVIHSADRMGRFARLVSDDRTRLAARHGRLVAAPVAPLEGCVEVRGVGILRQPFESAAVIRLVVDLEKAPPRYPEEGDGQEALCGVMLPRLRVGFGAGSAHIVLSRLGGLYDTVVTL
jgi:serine kinase of HPr protein (carbohydrate metabolism regulator)